MGLPEPPVQKVLNLLGMTALGRKAQGAGMGVTLSNEDLAAIQQIATNQAGAATEATIGRIAPNPTTIVARGAVPIATQLQGEILWKPPANAGQSVYLRDLVFSTQEATSFALYQSTVALLVAKMFADGATHVWAMNDTASPAVDSAASGTIPLTAVGVPTFQSASLITANGKSIDFNGSTAGLAAASVIASSTTGAVEAWYKPDTYPSSVANRYFALGDAASTYHMGAGVRVDGKPTWIGRNSGALTYNAYGQYAVNRKMWNHTVWQHDGTGLELFSQGELGTITYDTGSTSSVQWLDEIHANLTNTTIGFLRGSTDSSFFDGSIALVAWYPVNKAASVWQNHFRLGYPLWGPHFFAANGGVNHTAMIAKKTEPDAGIYLSSSAAITANISVNGYEA